MSTSPIGSVLEQVRQRMPLTDYLAKRGYTLRQTARNRQVALCPFHADKRRPNMVIYTDEQRFHCFACGARGDLVDMAQHLEEHPDFTSALRALTEQLQIPWPDERTAQADDASSVLALSAKLYAEKLTASALQYLVGRGFPEAFVRKWRVGYAPERQPQFLRNALKQAGVSPDAAFAAGVVVATERAGGTYVRDFFAASGGGYLIFPNPGRRGAVCDLQGRAFPESESKPKYLNLPRSRRYMFNEAVLPQPSVVLTEGIPDALSCLLVDAPAVATYGTAGFSGALVNRFARCRRVYVAFDLDVHERSIQVAMQFGLRGRALVLPDALGRKGDLNDLLARLGPERFREQLQHLMRTAETGFAMAINHLPADFDPYDLFETASPLLAALAALDPISRDAHLALLHTKYAIAMDTLREAASSAADVTPSAAAAGGGGADAPRD